MANLVILESPSKAATVKSYLGSNYKVIASKGHIRDLPKSTLGIDIDDGFKAHYINIRGKGDVLKEIKKEAKNAKKVYIATDPDREGEAIAWHLATALEIEPEKTTRITFNEVTKTAVKEAIANPRKIDMDLVNAQQARRILDRIVGYKISPFLWKNIRSGLSAGRVQSVATRIIVDREEEIKAFEPKEYWTIDVILENKDKKSLKLGFYGDKNKRIRIENEAQANEIIKKISGKDFVVSSIKESLKHKQPAPPFITSTMQQEAYRKLGFQTARTMKVAQELYEGVNVGQENGGVQGIITYMRTDSFRISTVAQDSVREIIAKKFGDRYSLKKPRVYKTKNGSQDAHEAIRPSRPDLEPAMIKGYVSSDQYRLYKLIWDRFTASQMAAADLETVNIDAECEGYLFKAGGYTVTFPGYMAVYEEAHDETVTPDGEPEEVRDLKIPALEEGEILKANDINPQKHFTEAPPRYTEATLVKFLEEKGIGRPSTYTPIITTILARNYVKRDGKMLVPTELGEVTTKLMKNSFSDIVDYRFTANMEKLLDGIESGNDELEDVLGNFWKKFQKELASAENAGTVNVSVPAEETDFVCEKCGRKMIVKNGRYGKFAACPNYPECKSTKPLTPPKETAPAKETISAGFACDKCGADMVVRSGKYGDFYACSRYPECKNIKQIQRDIGVSCPKCGGKLIARQGKNKTEFFSCENYPKCDFSSWDMPTDQKCPTCGKMLYVKKSKGLVVCHDRKCGYSKELTEDFVK